MRRLTDTLLAASIPLLILLHLFIAPYTKVEESFNIQATHDILTYGLPVKQFEPKLRAQYDHLTFPGSVPRTFVGPLALAAVSWLPLRFLQGFDGGLNRQILVRAVLGLFNAFCLLSFRNAVLKSLGRNTANWFLVFQAGQFHLLYYASRTLPNFFAFGFTTLALRDILVSSQGSLRPENRTSRSKRALTTLTAIGVIFRSEIAILLSTHTLYLFIRRRNTIAIFQEVVLPGLLGLSIGLSLTVPIDSCFWLRFPLWPELSGFVYNVVNGQASNWGTSTPFYYFTSALPRLFFNPFTYLLCAPFAIIVPGIRAQALDILVPNLTFIAIYSLQPHKEWRFIIYVIPPLLTIPAAGASWIWTRRSKSQIYLILTICIVLSSIASFVASLGMLAISSLNYPGADALNRMHWLSASEKGTLRVHMDTLACVNGVTRFLQIPPSNITGEDRSWVYDKTEDPERLLHPDFWESFDYALAEMPERAIGKWEIIDTVDGFAGLGFLKPGEGIDAVLPWLKATPFSVDETLHPNHDSLSRFKSMIGAAVKAGERLARKYITRGWWVGVKMETKINVLRKQRTALNIES